MDELPVRQRHLQLPAELTDVNIDGAVSLTQLVTPHGPVELLAGDDRAESARHRREELELPDREREGGAPGENEAFRDFDLQLSCVERVRPVGRQLGPLDIGRHDGSVAGGRENGVANS